MTSKKGELMMKNSNALSMVLISCVFLSACSNTPPPPKRKIVDTRSIETDNGSKITILTENAINGEVIEDTDNSLNLVAKTENVKLLGLQTLQVAAALLGGGSASVEGYSKEQLKGVHIDSVKNKTMDYLNPEFDLTLKSIKSYSGKNGAVIVQPYKFKLIYEGLGSDDYEFIYSTTIRSGNFIQVCSSSDLLSSERIQPIRKWEENNYELTQSVTKK